MVHAEELGLTANKELRSGHVSRQQHGGRGDHADGRSLLHRRLGHDLQRATDGSEESHLSDLLLRSLEIKQLRKRLQVLEKIANVRASSFSNWTGIASSENKAPSQKSAFLTSCYSNDPWRFLH